MGLRGRGGSILPPNRRRHPAAEKKPPSFVRRSCTDVVLSARRSSPPTRPCGGPRRRHIWPSSHSTNPKSLCTSIRSTTRVRVKPLPMRISMDGNIRTRSACGIPRYARAQQKSCGPFSKTALSASLLNASLPALLFVVQPGYPNPRITVRVFSLARYLSLPTTLSTEDRRSSSTLTLRLSRPFNPEDEGEVVTEVAWIGPDELLVRMTDRSARVERIGRYDLASAEWRQKSANAKEQVLEGEVVRETDWWEKDGGWAEAVSVGCSKGTLLTARD